MPSKTSEYLPLPGAKCQFACADVVWGEQKKRKAHSASRGLEHVRRTYLSDDFVILQHAPGDVDAVIVPIGPGHVLIDISVDASHDRW